MAKAIALQLGSAEPVQLLCKDHESADRMKALVREEYDKLTEIEPLHGWPRHLNILIPREPKKPPKHIVLFDEFAENTDE